MVQVKNISNQHRGIRILKDINFSIKEGDFLVLFGADNAGKTLLLHILMGFDTSYSGKVWLMGTRPNDLGTGQREKVRFIPDDLLAGERMTGHDYLRTAKEASAAYDEELQWELCEGFGVALQEKIDQMDEQNNKLVQIIGALCARPKLLILDEPFNYLGKKASALLLDYLKRWNTEGMTVLLAVEQYEEAMGYGNRYLYMKNGKIAAKGQIGIKELRGKYVVTAGGDEKLLRQYMTKCVRQYADKTVYYYKGNMQKLAAVLYTAACENWYVEDRTLREELDDDLGRWDDEGKR